MKQSNNYRLLQLKELLFNETDEEHEFDIYEIEERLIQTMGLNSIDHRTIRNDIEALQEMDFDVVRNRRKFGKIFYSHQVKLFETYQLRLLVDAILSARFITPKEKNTLIDKLKELTSIHIRKTLPEPVLFSQTVNMDYEQIKFNIDRLHHAITGKRVVTYKYGDFNVHKEFEFRRNGDRYFVEPYALIWQNDLYYLIGKFQETEEIRHYRLDRIREIEILNKSFAKDKAFELQQYVDNTFHMYSGEEVRMAIRFEKSLINAIFDRFGMEVDVIEDGEHHFILKTKAKLSDGLVSWILKWGHRAKVISPEDLVDKVNDEVRKMVANYE